MHMTVSDKIAFGAMVLAACAVLSPAVAQDEAEAKPAAEGETEAKPAADGESADGLPAVAAKQEKFFFPLVRCERIEGCSVKVMKSGSGWTVAEEGKYYPLGSAFRVEVDANAVAKAEFGFGESSVIRATNALEFATEAMEVGAKSRTVLLRGGRFSLVLPRALPDGLFRVKAPYFVCSNLAGESAFEYVSAGDGDEAVVRCVTGSMALEGSHYKIARMGAANQIRIRTTGDNLFTSLRGESGDYTVSLDQGLIPEKNFETGEVKEVTKVLDFPLSPQCAVKIFRRKAAVEGKMIVSMMTFNPAGEILNRCAYAEGRANVNTGELIVASAVPDADKEKAKKADADAAETVETVAAKPAADGASGEKGGNDDKKSDESDI